VKIRTLFDKINLIPSFLKYSIKREKLLMLSVIIILNMEEYNKILTEISRDLNLIDSKLKEWNLNYFLTQKNRYISDLKFFKQYYKCGEILEVGSLPYHFTAILKQLGYPIIGLNLNPNRAKEFINKYKLNIIECDVENEKIPFGDNIFGFIIFNEIFEHLRIDPIFTLKELYRVLNRDGVMMLTTPNLYSLVKIIAFLSGRGFNDPYEEFNKLHSLGHVGHIREYSTREVKKFLENTGFKIIDVKYRKYEIDRKFIFKSLEKEIGPAKARLTRLPLTILDLGLDLFYKINPKWRPMQMIICKKEV